MYYIDINSAAGLAETFRREKSKSGRFERSVTDIEVLRANCSHDLYKFICKQSARHSQSFGSAFAGRWCV